MNTVSAQFNFKYIIAISFISALGGYLFGFDFAVISGALPFLKDQFGLNEYWEGFTTGCLALGAIIGCLIAGGLAEKYGRRYGLLTAASIFAISSLGMATANNLTIFYFCTIRSRYRSRNGIYVITFIYCRGNPIAY